MIVNRFCLGGEVRKGKREGDGGRGIWSKYFIHIYETRIINSVKLFFTVYFEFDQNTLYTFMDMYNETLLYN
jgi:hypothetical protein